MAQATQPHAHHPAAAASADVDVPVTAEAAVAVAERFNSALSSGDLATVEALLAADVLILESGGAEHRSEEHTSELQSLMRISYAAFCSKKKHIPRRRCPKRQTTIRYYHTQTTTTNPQQVSHP